jgi:DNA-binding NarL/FixJ family response regulator
MIVDDHPIVRQGLRAALEKVSMFTIVGEADNADDAISAIGMLSPDLVMLDIRLKGGRSGIEVANELRTLRSDLKIVILTNHAQEPYLRAMIEAGVDGYLLKDTPPGQIVESIEKVVLGKSVFSESLGASVPTAYIGSEASGDLSAIEAEVLQMVADGESNQEIASKLKLDRRLVQMHLARSFAKLGVGDRDEAIAKAAEEGVIVVDD